MRRQTIAVLTYMLLIGTGCGKDGCGNIFSSCAGSGGSTRDAGVCTAAGYVVLSTLFKGQVDLDGTGCEARVVYTLTPDKLTGSTGQSNAVTIDQLHKDTFFAGQCTFVDMSAGLRGGTWKIVAATPNTWKSSECAIAVAPCQSNTANFTFQKFDCKQGFEFPQ